MRRTPTIFALVLSILLAASAPPLRIAAADPYEIPAVLPLTGPGAFLGKNEAQTLELLEADVNAKGGIRGRPVKFVIEDDSSSPQVAVQLTNALVAKKVPIILGGSLLASCLSMTPLVRNNGPVLYCFSPGKNPAATSNVFATFVSTEDLLASSLRYLYAKGVRKLAVLSPTDATGQDGDSALAELLQSKDYPGLSAVATEHFNVSDISVVAQLSRIKGSGATAMVAWTTGTAFGTVLHGMSDLGLRLPTVTSTGNLIYEQMKAYSSLALPDLLFPGDPAVASNAQSTRGVRDAVATFTGLLKSANAHPDQGHALGYDAAFLVVQALRKLGTDATAAQRRGEIAGTRSWDGIFGHYDFSKMPQRGIGRETIVMVQWDAAKDAWIAVSRPGGQPD